MRELESSRREIDEIDAELVRLFERRMGVCRDVALYKQAHYMDILNAAREETVLKSRAQQVSDPALAQSVMALFTEIMRLSREEQRRYLEAQTQTRLIAYSGVPGAYSECAVVGFFGEDCERVSFKTFDEVFAAVADAVRAIGYTGAGTLEFLRDPDGNLWFMEMNVRLQVEHAVSEMLTLVDLVKWQIRTAAGVSLPFSQTDIPMKGAVIECRINALSPGTVSLLHVPGGPFVRFDTYLVQGVAVSPFYDSLVGKLIVYAATREEALRKMRAALCELVIDGVETNIAEQLRIISDPRFASGAYDLTMMEE